MRKLFNARNVIFVIVVILIIVFCLWQNKRTIDQMKEYRISHGYEINVRDLD